MLGLMSRIENFRLQQGGQISKPIRFQNQLEEEEEVYSDRSCQITINIKKFSKLSRFKTMLKTSISSV